MKFRATLDFIHPTLGSKHFRDKIYDLDEQFSGNELLERVGYIKRLDIEITTPNEIVLTTPNEVKKPKKRITKDC